MRRAADILGDVALSVGVPPASGHAEAHSKPGRPWFLLERFDRALPSAAQKRNWWTPVRIVGSGGVRWAIWTATSRAQSQVLCRDEQ